MENKDPHSLQGNSKSYIYFIDLNNVITCDIIGYYPDYKIYTLEEFKKEFPFRIGDRVVFKNDALARIHIITGLEFYKGELCYLLDYSNLHYSVTKLELHQSMKEERSITLTIDKAKEWYNNGGELKEVALQAFTEQELNPLPKSWEEFIKSTKFTFSGNLEYINGIGHWNNGCFPNKSIGESSKIWNKYLALFKLERLRDCYRQGWKPDWKNLAETKYCITLESDALIIRTHGYLNEFLSFQSVEIAREFLKNFEPLIKEAEDLI